MRRLLTMTVFMVFAFTLAIGFVSVKDAEASDAIMFPWIVKSSAVSTLVSVVNTQTSTTGGSLKLHYQYWYKADDLTSTCTASSFERPTTKNDLVTFDAAGYYNSGKALFGDNTSYGTAPANTFHLTATAPKRAFLLVDNIPLNQGTETAALYGEAIVLEIAGGAAWGYVAYNPTNSTISETSNAAVLFADTYDSLGEVIGDLEVTQTVFLPPDQFTTKFFITPVDSTNQRTGNANTRIQLCMKPTAGGSCDQGGIYDNNENPMDFDKNVNIVCTAAGALSSFMEEGHYNTLYNNGLSSWAYIVTNIGTIDADLVSGADNAETGAIIGKLEYTTTGATISGTSVPGTFNNFIWLKDSETANPDTSNTGINSFEYNNY